MSSNRNVWAAYGSTSLFVLLWSGGAIFAKWGLAHASAFGFLLLVAVLVFRPQGLRATNAERVA